MKIRAIEKAKGHFQQAASALSLLNLKQGLRSYEEAWSHILAQASRVYSALEQGSKGCERSEPWYGSKRHERKSDELLAYVLHARNHDEHGLEHITQRVADGMAMRFPASNQIRFGVDVMRDEAGHMHMRNPRVQASGGRVNRVDIFNPRVVLVTVTDRGVRYNPPTTHRGRSIDGNSPPEVAALLVSYMSDMLKEAATLPIHN